jgi:hypothetical protein
MMVPTTMAVNSLGKVRFSLTCPETYDKCKGDAVLKIGGKMTDEARYSLGSGESVVRKLKLPPSALAKLAREGFLVGWVRVGGVVGGTANSARTTVVVTAAQ